MGRENFSKDIEDAMDSINTINPYASYLNESTLSSVEDWIDTGSMVLNAIISGSLYKGVPKGRVVQLAGPSQCLTKNQTLTVYRMRSIIRSSEEVIQ